MSYVVRSFESGLYTVGHYDGERFHPESDHAKEDDAAERAAWLNGSAELPAGFTALMKRLETYLDGAEARAKNPTTGGIDATALVWLVWSSEHSAWWGPGERDYTPNIRKAGRYTLQHALDICRRFPLTQTHGGEFIQPSPELIQAFAKQKENDERERRRAECRCGGLCDSGSPCPMRYQ